MLYKSMSVNIRTFDDFLFKIFYSWCDAHQFPKLPRSILSSRGYMAFIEDKPIIAGFLYKDETSGFCLVEWVVSNPNSSSEEREEGLKELINQLRVEAKKLGGIILYTMVQNVNLIQRYLNNGFQVTDQNMTHLMSGV